MFLLPSSRLLLPRRLPSLSLTLTLKRILLASSLRPSLVSSCNVHVTSAPQNKSPANMSYVTEQHGALYSTEYRLYFKKADDGSLVSPMHDIPLYNDEANKVFNMVVEVPRWSNAKMEINLKQPLNPIKQDMKKGKLRFVANCFPHHGYIWNYGYLPQTWEDPEHVDANTNCKGDGDPIDVCEIGQRVQNRGEVLSVKILGTIALIDEGETDWKVLAIDTRDPLAEKLNDIDDIQTHMPGFIAATVEWFKIYKMPDGKPANEFAFDGRPKDREFALGVVAECNEQWKAMMKKDGDDPESVKRACTQFECASKINADAAKAILSEEPVTADDVELDTVVDKNHFVKL
jgi:nucleosome-remodeling factor subunit